MRNVIYSLAILLSVVMSSCGGESKSEEHNHEGHDHSEMSNTKYACPMQCEGEKTYDEKGECPVCKMDLEKME